MGRKSKLNLPPLKISSESFGKRLSMLRKKKRYTQAELATKIGITQGLVSDYELDKLRPYHEMIMRFAIALEISTDELLGFKKSKQDDNKPNLKFIRRLKKIEQLPIYRQKILLSTIDTFLKGVEK
jgi:transcriptional regulator with XRE-family HTH domain